MELYSRFLIDFKDFFFYFFFSPKFNMNSKIPIEISEIYFGTLNVILSIRTISEIHLRCFKMLREFLNTILEIIFFWDSLGVWACLSVWGVYVLMLIVVNEVIDTKQLNEHEILQTFFRDTPGFSAMLIGCWNTMMNIHAIFEDSFGFF